MVGEYHALIGLLQSWRDSQLLRKLEGKEWGGVPRWERGDQKADYSLRSGKAEMSTLKARFGPRSERDPENPSFCFPAALWGHWAGMPALKSLLAVFWRAPDCAAGLRDAFPSVTRLLLILGRCRVLEPGQGSSGTEPPSWGPGVPSRIVTVVT